MIYGTRAEIGVIAEFLRRIQLRNPELNIKLHDLARELESLSDQCVDGSSVASHVSVIFRGGGEIRLTEAEFATSPGAPTGSQAGTA